MNNNYWDLYCQKQKDFVVNGGNVDSFTGYELMELWECIYDNEDDAYRLLFKAMLKRNRQAANYCLQAAIKGHSFEHNGKMLSIFDINKLAADTGEPESAYNLGMQYGLQENYEEAFTYYRIAAEGNNPNGMARLAMFYAHGHGVKKCPEIAAYWIFEKPHYDDVESSTMEEFRHTAVHISKSLNYINNDNGQISCVSEEEVIKHAAEAGERDALVFLAKMQNDDTKAKEYCKKAADLGSPNGQLFYAILNKDSDEKSFVKYSILSCEQGCAPAQQVYAQYLLEKGNITEAKKWLEAIVNHGNSKSLHSFITWAYNELAYMYYNEGNKERALFCWHCTDGEYAPRNTVDWKETEEELYPSITRDSQNEVEQQNDVSSNTGCMLFLTIPFVVGVMAYWLCCGIA